MVEFNHHDPHAASRPGNGGTFITNFSEEARPIYEAAIQEYGDPMLVIRASVHPCLPGGSLHDLTAKRRELGPFWRVYDRIKSEAA